MKIDRLLETYCLMDNGAKAEMLATAESFMNQRGKVLYQSQEYHTLKTYELTWMRYAAPMLDEVDY